VIRAIALACGAEHASELVYADNRGEEAATPIGVTCRLCNRAECQARALPPIGRDVLPDDYRRSLAPFEFAES
jgi:predicted transcriptional regulator